MKRTEVLEALGSAHAIITGSHIVYASGKHGSAYVNKDAIYPHTSVTSNLCRELAEQFVGYEIDVVIAPAVGGVILSQWVAYHINDHFFRARVSNPEVFGVYADKEMLATNDPEGTDRKCFVETGNFVIKRGYDKLVADKRVLVVEDILTTGGSVKKVVEAVRAQKGYVVGVGVLCNRGGVRARDIGDVPKLVSLVDVTLDAWDEKECPLCKEGVPINTDVGKGREFLARKKQ